MRERRSESFDADRFVNREWSTRVMPQLEASAVPVSRLLPAAASDLDAAGEKFGRKVGEGSPWTFVVRGEGAVRAIDNQSREGTIDLLVPLGTGSATIAIQTGPVIIDNSLRDALPFVSFNDFSGQIAFAEVGRSLTQLALAETGDILRTFQVGDEVSFLGTLNLSEDRQIARLIPVRVTKIGGADR
jgi:predicted lipoprotein